VTHTIDQICEMTGYSRRTIRYYVQIGLIEPPAGRGRGGFYNDSNLTKLRQIKTLQEKGMNLAAITAMLKSGKVPFESYVRDVWVKYEISPGIEISVRKDVEEGNRKMIFDMIRVAKSITKEGSKDE